MTLWASFNIILGVVEYFRPVIPLVDNFVGEGASSRVVSTIAVVDFLHDSPSFVWPETSQIWVRMETGVGFIV